MAAKHSSLHEVRSNTTVETSEKNGSLKSRRLFIMRHGERCDFAFGRTWMKKCFDDKGMSMLRNVWTFV